MIKEKSPLDPPSSFIIYNKELVLYIPDGFTDDPKWDNIKVVKSKDSNGFNIVLFKDNDGTPLFSCNNLKIIDIIKNKNLTHKIAWGANSGNNNREITIDTSELY